MHNVCFVLILYLPFWKENFSSPKYFDEICCCCCCDLNLILNWCQRFNFLEICASEQKIISIIDIFMTIQYSASKYSSKWFQYASLVQSETTKSMWMRLWNSKSIKAVTYRCSTFRNVIQSLHYSVAAVIFELFVLWLFCKKIRFSC